MPPDRFDAIIIGAGPAGEVVATRLPERGMRVALVEHELLGGECAYWACIPSKTLLRPGEVRGESERAAGSSGTSLAFDDAAKYRDYMIRDLDDKEEIEEYEGNGVHVVKGVGRLRGGGEVEVDGTRLSAERVVIATGSEPRIPPIEGLEEAGYWTNREATTISEVPESVVVLGGGPVGIELAQLMRRFGAEVHLVEEADRLLAREDPRVGELVLEALRGDGIEVRLNAEVKSVTSRDGLRALDLGGEEVSAHELVVAVGRAPRLDGLSLESAGIEPGPRGIEIDERCRAAEGIWAIGDVTGQMPFTHVAKYQARIASADILGEPVRADYTAVPRVVFSDPEVACVGMTEAQAKEAGIRIGTASLPLAKSIARAWTYETDPRGELAVVADRDRGVLAGAWGVGPLASEWIHYAALAMKAQIPIAVLKDTVAQFPTFCEAYLKVLESLEI